MISSGSPRCSAPRTGGDDLPDMPLSRRVGLAIAVANAAPELKAISHYVTQRRGGEGAAREAVELLLKAQGFRILSEMPAPAALAQQACRQHLFMGVWQRIINTSNLGGPGLDVGDHLACNVAVFEDAHARLSQVLSELDSGPAAEPDGR